MIWFGGCRGWAAASLWGKSPAEAVAEREGQCEKGRLDPHIYGQLISDNSAKTVRWEKRQSFNKWCWEKWISSFMTTYKCRRMKLDPYFIPHIKKINSKWIKDLNLNARTLRLWEENVEGNLHWICNGIHADLHWVWQWFFGYNMKSTGSKRKIN